MTYLKWPLVQGGEGKSYRHFVTQVSSRSVSCNRVKKERIVPTMTPSTDSGVSLVYEYGRYLR